MRRIDGLVTPESDEAAKLGSGGGLEEQGKADSGDSARELIATAIAKAALLGIECRPIGADAWLLRHARGPIGTVQGRNALQAVVAGFEAACADMRALVRQMEGAA